MFLLGKSSGFSTEGAFEFQNSFVRIVCVADLVSQAYLKHVADRGGRLVCAHNSTKNQKNAKTLKPNYPLRQAGI